MALQAASREALAAVELKLLDTLEGAAVDDLGEQLFAVVGLLDREIGLRRALADHSTDPADRERLVRGLLGGKIGDGALDVVVAAVVARWSSPRGLVDGLEALGTTALLVRAERAGRLDAVEDELFRLGRIIAGQTELEQVLSDRGADKAGKLALIHGLIEGKTDATTVALVDNLIGQPRGRDVVSGLEALAAEAAKRRERSVAHVVSATVLSAEQQDRLSTALQRIYARPIALHLEVDPGLQGGMVVRVGDEVIDGSVAGRLDALRRRFAA
ncbi:MULTISPECIES: F0F1 ATP synthase subunit delta [Actinokineospora]|uniref:ATP synthase subunit delta n=1 Tax=Actinokineospora fastidiosa TaxID=1816 RepID=A0A918GQM5_9PSEU|nr:MULTISPECIES: F0F1 ATP synthase subunit delta [Actinokineospora]UVS81373.1 F-type ATPase subunit delta [Actinokineospora sp. UTMC 2448]GGS53143.1 ATP synthase subunit delta [Actinokineospora fastidiosa]